MHFTASLELSPLLVMQTTDFLGLGQHSSSAFNHITTIYNADISFVVFFCSRPLMNHNQLVVVAGNFRGSREEERETAIIL